MKRLRTETGKRLRAKLASSRGFSLGELMLVVAIIGILGGVVFIAIQNYRRSLGQLERDSIAKQIFVAAQNHLTAAYGEGYLGVDDYGNEGEPDDGVYYIVVVKGKAYTANVSEGEAKGGDALSVMLPFGSIDGTVNTGSYLIRYQPKTATVLDVFYCTISGNPEQFNHTISDSKGEYAELLNLRGTDKKPDRYNWNGAILGWYGGEAPGELGISLAHPELDVSNGDTLSITVTDNNYDKYNTDSDLDKRGTLRIIIEGELSGVQHYYTVAYSDLSYNETEKVYQKTYTLDEITSSAGHFYDQEFDDAPTTQNGFIPGENLIIQAVAFHKSKLANIAYSEQRTTNSLFADGSTVDTAYISNIRHLENLDRLVSHLDANDNDDDNSITADLNITKAVQTAKVLNWSDFTGKSNGIYYFPTSGTAYNATAANNYYPISPDYDLTYDGQGNTIKNVTVSATDAGLFGSVSKVTEIKNLELIDFTVTATGTATDAAAGALAGSLQDCTVRNVVAYNSTSSPTATITASSDSTFSGSAGGLIGSAVNCTVEYSAAAVVVNGSTTAGGLIGTASGTITGCFSGGHTTSGSYEKWGTTTTNGVTTKTLYDVTGATAGGLVGSFTGTKIEYSYSTCSVSGSSKAGGFAGAASGSISHCYAAGLVGGTAAAKYAFLADGTPTLSDNKYYQAANQVLNAHEIELLPPTPNDVTTDKLTALDETAKTYDDFVGKWDNWNSAKMYDPDLETYYNGRYTLQTVDELGAAKPDGYDEWAYLFVFTHYGDWPAPEVFFTNKKS